MDYIAELAENPDLPEALRLIEEAALNASEHKLLTLLLEQRWLSEELPNTWTNEVIHAFYVCPSLAAKAWVHLRYGKSFLTKLAREILAGRYTWGIRAVPRIELERILGMQLRKLRQEAPELQIARLAAALAADRARVNDLCARTGFVPAPPQFIGDLQRAAFPKDDADKKIQELLANPDKVRVEARNLEMAVPFSMVLERELAQLGATRALKDAADVDQQPAHPLRRALHSNLVGLAFSGGGIRSATFNLGVLQALARNRMLKRFDYLSTVSGGGYIGSWFHAFLRRQAYASGRPVAALEDIERRLSPECSPNPMEERVKPLRYLREYSNYLTPRVGLMSADTWTMFGIYLRNTLLNQVIIVSLLAAALLIPRVWRAALIWQQHHLEPQVLPLVTIASFFLGTAMLVLNLRRLEPRTGLEQMIARGQGDSAHEPVPPWYAKPFYIQVGVVGLWYVGTALWMYAYGRTCLPNEPINLQDDGPRHIAYATALLLGTSLIAGGAHRSWLMGTTGWTRVRQGLRAFGAIIFAVAISALVAMCLGWTAINVLRLFAFGSRIALLWHFTVLGPSALSAVLSIAMVAMLGILGRRFPDEHREWWSRLRTFMHVWALACAAWVALALYVPWAVEKLELSWSHGLPAFGAWIGATIFGVKKGQTAEDERKRMESTDASFKVSGLVMRSAVAAAPYVCILGLIVAVALGIHAVFRVNAPESRGYWQFVSWTTHGSHGLDLGSGIPRTVVAMLGLVVIGLIFSWRVDINEFSIHHFYRNRLVRCYLGASHAVRKADWFTGFDPRDDMPLKSFDHDEDPEALALYPGPYPIVNCALNLVGGQELAWQERKAASFVFTPKYCGYDLDRAVLRKSESTLLSEAYVPTATYHDDQSGPPLGMAMAISGAAANPNMGRATTPGSAFLMTVFNVRLGWWIKNPRHLKLVRPSPRFGLPYTALELFGGTDDSRKYVNVSDGGHFDNLGVYELIRRGCRCIIVSDAGQDEDATCEDLGSLVRKCRTDFGVEIDIDVSSIRGRDRGKSAASFAIGKIEYLNIPRRNDDGRLIDADGSVLQRGMLPDHEVGYLLYIKPAIVGDEPQDIQEYNLRIPEFPHQSTADQWFDESQFESYRKLGMHIGHAAFSRFDASVSLTETLRALYEASVASRTKSRELSAVPAGLLRVPAKNDNVAGDELDRSG